MRLFTPDLYRNFAAGFALGAIGLLFAQGDLATAIPQMVAAIF